jgi:hypothetical protein
MDADGRKFDRTIGIRFVHYLEQILAESVSALYAAMQYRGKLSGGLTLLRKPVVHQIAFGTSSRAVAAFTDSSTAPRDLGSPPDTICPNRLHR